MSLSDANSESIKYSKESAWGETPAGPAMQEINYTGESLKSTKTAVTSDTIRDDKNVSDITNVGGGAGGDVNFELRYSEYDDLIAGALQSSWVTTAVSAAVASCFFSGGTIESDSSALNSVLAGQFLRVKNATTSANNGDYRVSSITTSAGRATLALNDASSGSAAAFTSEVFAASTTLKGKVIRNGVTLQSFLLEKEFSDVQLFSSFPGMRVTSFNEAIRSRSILNGTFGFTGKGETPASTSVASTSAAASVNPIMNASGNVSRVWEGGNAVTGIVFKEIIININNNPREQDGVGSDVLYGVATGRTEITGSFNAYLQNNAIASKFTNGTITNLRFQVDDENGNSLIQTVPKIRLTDQSRVAGGGNQDVMENVTWGAMVDDSGLYAIQIDALDA